jgi:hypothetical protein
LQGVDGYILYEVFSGSWKVRKVIAISEFTGYKFIEKGGSYESGIPLNTVEECFDFVFSNIEVYPELRVCDKEDFLVIQALAGKIVFPTIT